MKNNEQLNDQPFSEYRDICADQDYRATGILDEDKYAQALVDENTVFSASYPGFPLVVDIGLVDGYDSDRIKKLLDSDDVRYVCLPPEKIEDQDIELIKRTVSQGTKIVIEDVNKTKLGDTDTALHIGNTWGESTDPAWIALYVADVALVENPGGMEEPDVNCSISSGSELEQDETLSREVWGLFRDKFGWLGDNHPVSMEDTEEFFRSVIHNPQTYTGIKRSPEGEVVAASIFMHDLEQCEWLDPKIIKTVLPDGSQSSLYFFGIAAKNSQDTVKHAEDLIKFQCNWEAGFGKGVKLIFESSELSSQYIPEIVKQYIDSSGVYHMQPASQVAKKTFSYLEPKA